MAAWKRVFQPENDVLMRSDEDVPAPSPSATVLARRASREVKPMREESGSDEDAEVNRIVVVGLANVSSATGDGVVFHSEKRLLGCNGQCRSTLRCFRVVISFFQMRPSAGSSSRAVLRARPPHDACRRARSISTARCVWRRCEHAFAPHPWHGSRRPAGGGLQWLLRQGRLPGRQQLPVRLRLLRRHLRAGIGLEYGVCQGLLAARAVPPRNVPL